MMKRRTFKKRIWLNARKHLCAYRKASPIERMAMRMGFDMQRMMVMQLLNARPFEAATWLNKRVEQIDRQYVALRVYRVNGGRVFVPSGVSVDFTIIDELGSSEGVL